MTEEQKIIEKRANDMQKAYKRAWYQKNKERVKKYNHDYWLRKASAEGDQEHSNNE